MSARLIRAGEGFDCPKMSEVTMGRVTFDYLVKSIHRVVREHDSYIEIRFSILKIRVYPSRFHVQHDKDTERARLKTLAAFMLQLSEEVNAPQTQFGFSYHRNGDLYIGLAVAEEGAMLWMPCEIVGIDRLQDGEPASVHFSFADDRTGQTFNVHDFRRIRLE